MIFDKLRIQAIFTPVEEIISIPQDYVEKIVKYARIKYPVKLTNVRNIKLQSIRLKGRSNDYEIEIIIELDCNVPIWGWEYNPSYNRQIEIFYFPLQKIGKINLIDQETGEIRQKGFKYETS